MEGDVRDLVRGIQNLRKEKGFDLTDRINLKLSGTVKLKAAWEAFRDYAADETLSVKMEWCDSAENKTKDTGVWEEIEAGEEIWKIQIEKA